MTSLTPGHRPGHAGPIRQRVRGLLPIAEDWTGARSRDLTAGVMVGLVALPLALGFGVSSGLGARAGLITAIVAGVVAGIFGGSRVQVSGPTGAMTVVLVPIAAQFGRDGVLVVGILAGAVLVGLAFARVGRYIHYVPVPVVEGFTLGIAAIITLQQLPAALGVTAHADKAVTLGYQAVHAWALAPTSTAPLLTLLGAATILVLARFRPVVPASLLVVVVLTALNRVLDLGAATIGHIPAGLPAPRFPSAGWSQLDHLLLPAVAVAALAALESLLSATVADAMSVGERHDPDRELFGQGLANLAVPLFGGIPATAAIARTAVNVRAGAASRLATVTHAVLLLVVVLAAARWVGEIPLAALAGVLIATAIQMVKVSSVMALVHATRGDAVVLGVTAVCTVGLDLVTAVLIGLVVAGFVALRQTARTARLDEVPLEEDHGADHGSEERRLLDEHIVAYRIDGPLFFAAAHDFLLQLAEVGDVRVVIVRMSRVTTLDATGATVLADTIKRLESRGITVLLSGVRPEHVRTLQRLGAYDRLAHERHAFASTPEAIEHARLHARADTARTPTLTLSTPGNDAPTAPHLHKKGRTMRLLIMGPPGSGKGTQATGIAAQFAIPAISTGDIFRANVAQQTELGRVAREYMDAGEYVPDIVTNAMVRDRLAEDDCADGFLLDGYPRTIEQVHELDRFLGAVGAQLDAVVELVVDPGVLVDRLLLRARDEGRVDDTVEVIRRRQELYHEQTAPLTAAYAARGVLHVVDGDGPVSLVAARIAFAVSGSLTADPA